jgi:DNA-directed RNA polymerase specialized sigma24 family protein
MGILEDKNETDELRRLAEDGWSDRQLAEHFGCSVMTVCDRCREHRIRLQEVNREEIAELVAAGMTDRNIADILDISLGHAQWYLWKYGYTQDTRHHNHDGRDEEPRR